MKHNGKYYLSFSVNSYGTSDYQIGQAVADSPLGPFRKLTEEEGGLLLSALAVESQPAGEASTQAPSGTGHNSFVTAGNQTYIIATEITKRRVRTDIPRSMKLNG